MNNYEKKLPEAPRPKRGASSFVDDGQQTGALYGRLGSSIRARREKLRLTQQELARKAGIDRSYLSEIEAGKRHVSLHIAVRLADLLGISIDGLLGADRDD